MNKLLVLLVSFFVGTLFWQAVVAETVSEQAPPLLPVSQAIVEMASFKHVF